MTTKEARKILKRWLKLGTDGLRGLTDEDERLGYIDSWFNRDDKEAFELAINALGVIDQLKWERDMLQKQLEKINEKGDKSGNNN
jgi:hypothetical protein